MAGIPLSILAAGMKGQGMFSEFDIIGGGVLLTGEI